VDLFWAVVIVLVILWVFGFFSGIGGSLINLLIVIALIIVVYRLYKGRNVVTGK
jgi:hypothetical protein